MFYKRIELRPKIQGIQIDSQMQKLFWHFLYALDCNGQILKYYKVIQEENVVLYATAPKEDSLDEKYDSVYVREDREKISELFSICVKDCGKDLGSNEYCECEKRSAMEMRTFFQDADSPFTCCDCGNPVALYELPKPKGAEDFLCVRLWRQDYCAIDLLWGNNFDDRYAGRQCTEPDSPLSRQGRIIAQYVADGLGYPVYYHLASDCGSGEKGQIHACPVCGQKMRRRKMGENEIDVCDECKLSYDAN